MDFKRFLAVLFITLSFLVSSVRADAAVSNSVYKTKFPCFTINAIDIQNFDKVDGYFYRGAQPNNYDIKSLSALGVKTIINLRKVSPFSKGEFQEQKKLAEGLGINYVNIPMSPAKPPTQGQIDSFYKIVNDPQNLPVYVHCAQGKDRTGIMTALYRVAKYGWNFDQAYAEMKHMGYHSLVFPKQRKFLSNYISSHYRQTRKYF